jgi:hypothetical protein
VRGGDGDGDEDEHTGVAASWVPLADVLEHGRALYAMLTKMIRR